MATTSSPGDVVPYSARPDVIRSANLPTLRGDRVTLRPLLDSPKAAKEWARRVDDRDSIIALDLFCGAGGMSLGLERAGLSVAAGIDLDRESCA